MMCCKTRLAVEKALQDYKLHFEENGNSVEVEFWSDAGEDCPVCLIGDTLEELVEEARKCFEDFDHSDHAGAIYHAKHYGVPEDRRFFASAPDSIEDLLEDAKCIKEKYRDIWNCLKAAKEQQDKEDRNDER